ncbi:amino acid adenylation domain-containing protein [Streptomyces sp. NPDC006703]|uniref:amino acid adenylation domain-containing protein n=1 Tax=Streptomyces sp. NPDC006703 TaxID=3364759 RepID=UPI00369BCABD
MPNPRPTGSALYRLFADQVARAGEHEAVRDQDRSLTYSELSARVRVLAEAVRERCPGTGSRIGLHLGRTVDLVAAVLAVTAAGHVYVPLDPAYPAERLRFMAEDSGLSLVVSDRDLPADLHALPTVRVDAPASLPEPAHPWAPADVASDAIAYVIYTSGSTGRPKGVEVRGSSVVAMVNSVRARYTFSAEDVWTLFHSYCFDFSVWEMWGALATGATLVLVPAETALSPRATVELLAREHVTVMSVVPSVFRFLTAAVRRMPEAAVVLRRVIFGGEAVDIADIRSWREALEPRCEFVNTYGITETTVFVSTRTLLDEELDREEPGAGGDFAKDLGRPLDGWEVQVLDEELNPVGRGATGEIWVAGDGVAVGYLGRPELTEERFRTLAVPGRPARRYYRSGDLATRTADDVYCYAGRADDQVKINGFRIELGEIEAVLRGVDGVEDAAVVCARSRAGGPVLTAFFSSKGDLPGEELADRARAVLPRHMQPSRFVRLAELPRNPSGKTDRKALSETR